MVVKKDRLIMAKTITEVDAGCCEPEVHTEHLCYIVSQRFDVTDEESYRALVRNPEFKCRHCARMAHSDKNLCVPVKA